MLYLYLLLDSSTRVTFSHLQLNLSSWNCPFSTHTILPDILPTYTSGSQHVHPTIPITMLYWPYALGICQASSFLSILTVTLLVAVASVFLSPITPPPLTPIHSLPYTKRKFCKWIFDHINTLSRTMQWLPIAFVIKLKCLRLTYKYFMDSSHAFPASSPATLIPLPKPFCSSSTEFLFKPTRPSQASVPFALLSAQPAS